MPLVEFTCPGAWRPLNLPCRLVRASALAEQKRDVLVSGLEGLDRLTGGFFPGEINELIAAGARAQALLYRVLAAASSRGDTAALIDPGDGFDADSACRAGVDLAKILWARPTSWSEALRLAEKALLTRASPLVVLEGSGMKIRMPAAARFRLKNAVRLGGAVLLLCLPAAAGGRWSALRLRVLFLRPRWLKGPAGFSLEGVSLQLRLERAPGLVAPQLFEVELEV